MAITYPLTLPAIGFRSISIKPATHVGLNVSPWTGAQQLHPHAMQMWEAEVSYPPLKDGILTGDLVAFLLALNGPQGTFYLGDPIRTAPRGTIAGTVTVGSGAVANTTTLPISGGTGSFAKGDWVQVGTGTSSRLYRVIQINSGSVDVWPRLRSAHASGTAITYTAAKGLFRLRDTVPWTWDERRLAAGVSFSAMEVIT